MPRAYVLQTNLIRIDANAEILSGGNVRLHAERLGLANVLGKASATTWASLLLGNDNQFKGSSSTSANGTVENNGIVRTGINRNQELVLDSWDRATGAVTASTQTEGITFTVTEERVQSTLDLALQEAELQLINYADEDPVLAKFYAAEVARLTALLQAEGLYAVPAGSPAGTPAQRIERTALTVRIAPITCGGREH